MEEDLKGRRLLFGLFMTLTIPAGLLAQQSGYFQTNLVSNTAGIANTTDPQLSNPWGISFIPGQDFWIANNKSGTSTLYDEVGNKDTALVVTIPPATKNPNGNCNPGCPTGTVANGNATYFGGGQFIFDTQDGLIAEWNGVSNTALVAFDNSASGAAYTGLALLNGTSLLAANFDSGKIDVFDQNFNLTSLSGSFTDPHLPAGYAPFGIHVIGNQIYVAYAMQNAAKRNAQVGAGVGQVDIFDMNGNFVKTFIAAGSQLNAPWGVVATPSTFGTFANAILVGNFGDGTISAFSTTGSFLGKLTDSSNNALMNPSLWDMVFGGGGTSGDPGTLYFTAGGTTSVFASIMPAAAAGSPDFSLSLSSPSLSVPAGQSGLLTVSATAVGGFSGPISLSCSSAAGLECDFNPSIISPGSSTSATLTVSAASAPPPVTGYLRSLAVLLPGLGLFGTVLTGPKRKLLARKGMHMKVLGLLLLVSLCSMIAVGCGGSGSGSSSTQTPGSGAAAQVIVSVTGTSGSITHSAPLTINVN